MRYVEQSKQTNNAKCGRIEIGKLNAKCEIDKTFI
jgi:hypothetical protein